MDPKLSKALQMFIMFLKMTPLNGFATALEADLADNKIDVKEGVGLTVIATAEAEKFLPGQAAELELANDVAEAVQKYLATKDAAAPPA